MANGIRKLHSKGCPGRDGGRCRCNAGWEASVSSKRDGKKIRKTFAREAEAKSWRADALTALDKGALRAPKPTTVRQAWETWHEGAKAGTIFRRAISLGEIAVNPCAALELPAVRSRRERFASPTKAESLIAAVPEGDRAILGYDVLRRPTAGRAARPSRRGRGPDNRRDPGSA